jgi:hypothetical protein
MLNVLNNLTYVVLVKEAQISQKSKINEERTNPKQYAGQREHTIVKISKFNGNLAYGSEYDQKIVNDNDHVPQIHEFQLVCQVQSMLQN